MHRKNLIGYTLGQMEELFENYGEERYRGRQLFKWLYNSRLRDFQKMTDFSRQVRDRLANEYTLEGLELENQVKAADGTEKFLFGLADGHPIEAVLIPDETRRTLCVSSQAGCALSCTFCATGTMGLLRNLTVGEIIGQAVFLRELYGDDCFTNVVFMGMGEPLNNYDNLVEALTIMSSSLGLGIAAKRTTVSTAGIIPNILKLADSGLKVRLAVSLHTAFQQKREQIMPVAKTYRLEPLMAALREYSQATGYRVTLEYVLMEGFNDAMEDVLALARLIEGLACKINVLAYNPVPGLAYKRPSETSIDWFARQLYPRAPAVTVRKSRGEEIDAACGQLAAGYRNRRK